MDLESEGKKNCGLIKYGFSYSGKLACLLVMRFMELVCSTRKNFLHNSTSLLFGILLLCHTAGFELEGKSLSAANSFAWLLVLIWEITVGEHISGTALLEK